MRLIVEAPDLEGVRAGMRWFEKYRDSLPRTRRDAYHGTGGDTETVRDFAVYGTPKRPIVHVGPAYQTPVWMKK